MRLQEFAKRLDDYFDLPRYAEPDGWDFAISAESKVMLLQRGSPIFRETFNGLVMLDGVEDREVSRVYQLVFPEAFLLDQVIASERELKRPGAVILTHHPLDMETSDRGFLDLSLKQIDQLAELGVSLYILHAPLDCHPEISTSGALADGLGLQRERTFAPYFGGDCGVISFQPAEPFDAFTGRVRLLCELPGFRLDQVRFAGREVSRVAVVAGGGDDLDDIAQAEALGCDTFLAGHWWTPHAGKWCDENRRRLRDLIATSRMNFLSASHDGSELVVFRDRLMPLVAGWGIETELIRQADHWR